MRSSIRLVRSPNDFRIRRAKKLWSNSSLPSLGYALVGDPGGAASTNWWWYVMVLIGLAAAAGLVARWVGRRSRDNAKRRASAVALTDCLIWDGTIAVVNGQLVSTIAVEPTALSARLFGERRRPERGNWWDAFDVPEREEMLARCRSAVDQRLASYEQEFQLKRASGDVWIHETVSLTPLNQTQFRMVGLATDISSQREAERARRTSEERIRQLLARSDCMLWQAHVTRDADGAFVWKWFIPESELYRRVAGNTPVPGMPWDRRNVPEFAEMEARGQKAMQEGKPSYEQEFRVVLQGAELCLHEQVIVRAIASDQWMLEGVTTNITAQREAEESKRASEAQLQRVMDAADFLLWHARVFEGPDGNLHWVLKVPGSRLFGRIFGREPVGTVVLPWDEVVSAETFEQMTTRMHQCIRGGAEKYEQEICAQRGGQLFWLHEEATIQRVSAAEWQLVGIVTDVTSRRLAEEARLASERALLEILERADCMLWRATVIYDGKALQWTHFDLPASRLTTELLGPDLKNHTNELWNWVDVPDLREMNANSDQAIFGGQPGYEQQFRAMREGRLFHLHERVSITPVSSHEWRLVGVITDVTQRQLALEAQRSSEARLEELLRRVDCMIWQGQVTRAADDMLHWQIYIPRSHLHRRLFGQNPNRLGFQWDQFAPEHLEMDQRAREAILNNRPGYEQVFHIPKPEGDVWLAEQVTLSQTSADHWDVVGVITDITARREAEEVKRATEAQLQQIIEMADCMVWQAKVERTADDTLLWNIFAPKSALKRRLFGEAEAAGVFDWTSVNVPERAEMASRAKEAIRSGAEGYEQEFRVILPGSVVWLRELVTISRLPNNQWRLVGVVTDITARRQAQEAHRISEAHVEQMLASVECLLWQAQVFEIEPGQMRWVMYIPKSRLFREIFQRDPAEPAQLYWGDAVDPETHAEIDRRSLTNILSGSSGYEQEFRAQRDDRVFWLHEQVSIARIGPGEWKLVGVITDMTARREAEHAVRASEVRYRTLYQHIPMAILETDFTLVGQWLDRMRAVGVTDLAAKIDAEPLLLVEAAKLLQFVDCNDTAMTMLRARTKSDFRRRRGLLATAESMGVIRGALQAIWEGRNTLEADIEMRDFEGYLHDMHLRWWMEVHDGKLDLEQSVMVLVDLTRLKQAEAALAAEKERLAVTLRAMAEGVITTDVEGVVQFINPAAAMFVGCTVEWAIGRVVTDLCRFENERTGEKVEVPVARVAMGDMVMDLPSRTKLVSVSGTNRLVDGCCAPIHSETSAVIGTVLVFRDVTEHERLEQELVRATRLESVGILAGGIAHDFNNILTVVLGNVALAALDLDPTSDAGHSLQEAEKATLRARDLTQQLLTFAKGGEPVRATLQLDGLVREITTFTLRGSKVKPEFVVSENLWPADADKGQIGRVVQNLVINAVQAMPEGGTITVTMSNERVDSFSQQALPPGDYVLIAIQDTGVGIKPEHLPRIFDPYFTTKQMGTGLGLAAVYSIVTKHNGTIDVDSHVGVGTTFRVWLPASHANIPSDDALAASARGVSMRGRVLFMDDEEPIRQMAAFLLRRFGFEVVCVSDGSDVVKEYAEALGTERPYVLVILDLTVPGGVGGREAIDQLRQIDPNVKAIVSSGYSSDPVLANFRAHGFGGVAVKPYELGDLARVLREVLADSARGTASPVG